MRKEENAPDKKKICTADTQPFPPYILISTHLRKELMENIVGKGEFAQNEQFHLFPECFLCNLYLKSLYQQHFSCCLQLL